MHFRNVTISTDISFHSDIRMAAYAFWISTERGPIKKSGMLKGTINDPNEAEMKCIANAVHFFKGTGIHTEHLIINTDSKFSIQLVSTNKGLPALRKRLKYLSKFINQTVFGSYDKVTFRHVKAHDGVDEKRKFVNDWCDKESKRIMKEYRRANGI